MWRLAMVTLIRDKYMELVGNTSSNSNPVVALPEETMQNNGRLSFAEFTIKKFHKISRINAII
jgi:hypothetical protein